MTLQLWRGTLQVTLLIDRSHVLKEEPSKALVLSFHGWTGGGKNFVAKYDRKYSMEDVQHYA